jgi:hypothetical protein
MWTGSRTSFVAFESMPANDRHAVGTATMAVPIVLHAGELEAATDAVTLFNMTISTESEIIHRCTSFMLFVWYAIWRSIYDNLASKVKSKYRETLLQLSWNVLLLIQVLVTRTIGKKD